MRQFLLNAALTTAALFAFCVFFPAASSIAAYIINSAPIFGTAFIVTALITRQSLGYWWAEHVQLRGVGSKSRWQRSQQKQGVKQP